MQRVLHCAATDVDRLRTALSEAASEEYANMLSGKYALNTISAVREFRLYLIIKHAYPNAVPAAEAVAFIFRMSASQGRVLLSTVLKKYREELRPNTRSATKTLIGDVSVSDDGAVLPIPTGYLVEAMNDEISELGENLRKVSLVPGTASIYKIPKDTYTALMALS
ncbi:hypothetical protein [Actinoplanes sp. NPDC051859]|uniref:hypothetical protein n=1 Tax=Actinoplanes sp. NPDC051859 TaxID=3363909 RepID=UPI003791A69F